MNGFERTWREEIIGNRAHFTVHHSLGPFGDYEEILEKVTAMPGVVSASPSKSLYTLVFGLPAVIVCCLDSVIQIPP